MKPEIHLWHDDINHHRIITLIIPDIWIVITRFYKLKLVFWLMKAALK
jgi:hypothetical protein